MTMAKTLTFENALYLIKENRTVEDAILTLQNHVIETKTVKISYHNSNTSTGTRKFHYDGSASNSTFFYNSKGEFFY